MSLKFGHGHLLKRYAPKYLRV